MASPVPRPPSLADLLRRLLDVSYSAATAAILRAIATNGRTGVLAQRLGELDAEAARLSTEGQPLRADNAVLRGLLADVEDIMRANGALLASAATALIASGSAAAGQTVRQMALPGMSDAALARFGVRWNRPDPAAVARVLNYTALPAWRERLARYGASVPDLARNLAAQGVSQGWGPARAVRAIRRAVEGLPVIYANTTMRTLQLTAYRDAEVLHRLANADILDYQVRIAALSGSCIACIALHGTRLPIDARIDDHFSGRCTSVSVVRGRAAPVIERGEDWLARQSPEAQRTLMGGAAYNAWSAGAVRLQDFVHTHTDPVFGPMVVEASLSGILGEGAQRYYVNRQRAA